MSEKILEELKYRADKLDAELLALQVRHFEIEEESNAVHVCIRALENYIDSVPEEEEEQPDPPAADSPEPGGEVREGELSEGSASEESAPEPDPIDATDFPQVSAEEVRGEAVETIHTEDGAQKFVKRNGLTHIVVDEPETVG